MCQCIVECAVMTGTRSAEGIMASGHVNRINRPNTWLHDQSASVKKSPCQPGAVHTWHNATAGMSSIQCPVLEQLRTRTAGRPWAPRDANDPVCDIDRVEIPQRGSPVRLDSFPGHCAGRMR